MKHAEFVFGSTRKEHGSSPPAAAVRNRSALSGWYDAALERWRLLLSRDAHHTPSSIARLFQNEREWFERHCGGERFGYAIMARAGFAHFQMTIDSSKTAPDVLAFFISAIEQSHLAADADTQ